MILLYCGSVFHRGGEGVAERGVVTLVIVALVGVLLDDAGAGAVAVAPPVRAGALLGATGVDELAGGVPLPADVDGVAGVALDGELVEGDGVVRVGAVPLPPVVAGVPAVGVGGDLANVSSTEPIRSVSLCR